MLTFILAVVGMFLLTALIFRKKLQQNVLSVVIIIAAGTLIICTLVNGIVGMSYPIHTILYKTKSLYKIESVVDLSKNEEVEATAADSLLFGKYLGKEIDAYLRYDFEFNSLDFRNTSIENFENDDGLRQLTINFYDANDTTKSPYVLIYKQTYDIPEDNLWVNTKGIPNFNAQYVLFVPNDSIHVALKEYTDKYLEIEHADENEAKVDLTDSSHLSYVKKIPYEN